MTTPGASNKRILLVSGVITPQLVANTIRQNVPELKGRVAKGTPAAIYPNGVVPTGWDATRGYEIFGKDWRYRDLKESVVDTVRDILQHEDHWRASSTRNAQ